MNPFSMVTGAITHPVRTAGSVAGQALGVAASGVKTGTRVIGWAATRGRDGSGAQAQWPEPTAVGRPTLVDAAAPTPSRAPAPATPAPATPASAAKAPAKKAPAAKAPATKSPAAKAPAKKAPSKKATPKRTVAKKAPSAKAATAGPALAAVARETGDEELLDSLKPDAEQPAAAPGLPEPEPLLDPSTVKALRSETEVMQRASDPDKG